MVGQFQRFDRTNKNTPTRKDTNMKQAKPATRSLSLPKPIAAYFAADRGDGEAVSQCFTDNAVVKDEGHTPKAGPQSESGRRMPRQSMNTHASQLSAKGRRGRR